MDAQMRPLPPSEPSSSRTLLGVGLALNALLGVASIGAFIAFLYLGSWRKYDLKEPSKWAIIGYLGSMSLFEIFRCPGIGLELTHPRSASRTLKTYNTAAGIISTFAVHFSNCLLFYIIYQVTHLFLRVGKFMETRHLSKLKVLHWFVLGVIIIAIILDWAFNTVYLVKNLSADKSSNVISQPPSPSEPLFRNMEDVMDSVAQIISWVASFEILLLNLYMVFKTKGPRRILREPTLLSSLTITLFFGLNMMKALTNIILGFKLEETSSPTLCAMVVVRAVFSIGIYAAIITLSLRWGLRRHYEHDNAPENWGSYLSPGQRPEEKTRVPVNVEEGSVTDWGFSWLERAETNASNGDTAHDTPKTPSSPGRNSLSHSISDWLNGTT